MVPRRSHLGGDASAADVRRASPPAPSPPVRDRSSPGRASGGSGRDCPLTPRGLSQHPSPLPPCPLPPALPREGAQQNPLPGRCCRLPSAAAARRSRYFPSRLPSAAAPVPLPLLPPTGSASLLPHGKHTQSPAPAPATRPIQTNKQKPAPSQSQPTVNFLMTSSFKCLKGKGAPGEGRKGASISRPGREWGRSCRRSGSVRPSCRTTGQGREPVCGGCVCRNREGGRGRGELKKQHS